MCEFSFQFQMSELHTAQLCAIQKAEEPLDAEEIPLFDPLITNLPTHMVFFTAIAPNMNGASGICTAEQQDWVLVASNC